jgi:hypothetical protein
LGVIREDFDVVELAADPGDQLCEVGPVDETRQLGDGLGDHLVGQSYRLLPLGERSQPFPAVIARIGG